MVNKKRKQEKNDSLQSSREKPLIGLRHNCPSLGLSNAHNTIKHKRNKQGKGVK